MHKWKSKEIYEHPAKHQAGTVGNVVLSTAGVYCLRVGASTMSCPQDWAAKIHKEENDNYTMILRNIPKQVRAQLKARAALENKSMQALVLQLIQEYLEKKEA
jgi:hypothetical protein